MNPTLTETNKKAQQKRCVVGLHLGLRRVSPPQKGNRKKDAIFHRLLGCLQPQKPKPLNFFINTLNRKTFELFLLLAVGYCPHPVTVFMRGPINGYMNIYIYNHIVSIIELLLRGGSTQGLRFRVAADYAGALPQ